MGNMMPCLVQQGTTALAPAMNPKQRFYSLNLLVKALHKMKKKPGTGSNSRAKIDSESSSSSSSAADGKGGGGELEVKIRANSNPKGAVLRSRLHGRSGDQKKKGVVRVKVVLTKEEAARLLSLTVGGQKTAAQIVAEIKRMDARRAANAAGWRPALESIPEESS